MAAKKDDKKTFGQKVKDAIDPKNNQGTALVGKAADIILEAGKPLADKLTKEKTASKK